MSKLPRLSPLAAILWATLIAGTVEIVAVLIYWQLASVPPQAILQAIASSLMGVDAYSAGVGSALLGLLLHYWVSLLFAGGYVLTALRVPLLLRHPIPLGLAYGALAKVIMDHIVVPLSRADFGGTAPSWDQLIVSWLFHMVLFGLPITMTASLIRRPPTA